MQQLQQPQKIEVDENLSLIIYCIWVYMIHHMLFILRLLSLLLLLFLQLRK